jgi:hypothetical protein
MATLRQIPARPVIWGVAAALAALPLSLVHPIFALGAAFICACASYYAFDAVSHAVFRKQFQPPLRVPTPEWDGTRKWSDWMLLVPFAAVAIYLLFAFGEIADCLAGQDFWKSGWSLCTR